MIYQNSDRQKKILIFFQNSDFSCKYFIQPSNTSIWMNMVYLDSIQNHFTHTKLSKLKMGYMVSVQVGSITHILKTKTNYIHFCQALFYDILKRQLMRYLHYKNQYLVLIEHGQAKGRNKATFKTGSLCAENSCFKISS